MKHTTFQTIKAGHRTVFFFRIESGQHITNHFNMTHISINEIGFHLFAGHLVIMNRIFHFHRQRLVDDMRPVNRAVIHINLDLLAK